MTADKSWQLGAPQTLSYQLFDALRKRLNRRLVRYLAAHALQREGSCVLEAGAGPAFASSLLARADHVRLSVAVDLDREALLEARRRDSVLPVVVADLYHLPFRRESFDLAWNSSTVEHLDARNNALREMARVTRRGGHVFVGVPYLVGPLGFQRWMARTPAGVWIGTVFSRAGLRAMLSEAGLHPDKPILYFFRFFIGALAEK